MPFLFIAIVVAFVAAITDWRTGKIPNWLTYGALVLAPLAHAALGLSISGLPRTALMAAVISAAGALLCGFLPWLLWLRGACGGGDVKLYAALGAILEPMMGFEVQLYSYYAAAFLIPIGLLYRGIFWKTLKDSFVAFRAAFRRDGKRRAIDPADHKWVRLGPAVLLACVLATFFHWRS